MATASSKQGIQKYKKAATKEADKISAAKAAAKAAAKEAEEKVAAREAAKTAAAEKAAAEKAAAEKAANKNKKTIPTESISAKPLADALNKIKNAQDGIAEETVLQAELEKEIVKDAPTTNKLVRGDYSPTNTERETLIVEYAGLIKFIAQKIASRLPSNIELDDLMSSGVIGLMDAIEKYDSRRDNKFKTYAEFRIRGAILDELRAQDWVPRSVREKAKILERCYARIEQATGKQATDEQVQQDLGISQEEFHDMLSEVRSVSLLSYDDLTNLSNSDKRTLHGFGENNSKVPTPFSQVGVAHLKKIVAEAIEDLPEKQRLVLSLYYFDDLNLKEIGRVLDVTESRVSQLHSQAIFKLKARLRNHWDDFASMMNI